MCTRGDVNTETGEISPDRGNHAISVTGAGRTHPAIPRRVRYLSRYLARAWLGRQVPGICSRNLTVPHDCRQGRCHASAQQSGLREPVPATFRDERGSAHAQVTAQCSAVAAWA